MDSNHPVPTKSSRIGKLPIKVTFTGGPWFQHFAMDTHLMDSVGAHDVRGNIRNVMHYGHGDVGVLHWGTINGTLP